MLPPQPKGTGQMGRAVIGALVAFQVLALLYFMIPHHALPSVPSYLPSQPPAGQDSAEHSDVDAKVPTKVFDEEVPAVTTLPPQQDEKIPQQNEEFPSDQNEDFPPEQNQEIPPQKTEEVPPQQTEEITPQQTEEVPPKQNEEIPPQQNDEIQPTSSTPSPHPDEVSTAAASSSVQVEEKPPATSSPPQIEEQKESAVSSQIEESTAVAVEPAAPSVPTVKLPDDVQFIISCGDSWSTTQFEPNITGPGSEFNPSAKNPIGNPEWPGRTTTHGRNWLGYMASEFNTSLTLVWNYAAGGSVVNPAIVQPRLPTHSTLVKQVNWVNTTIGHRPDYAPWNSHNTVAAVWFGLNDMTMSREFNNLTTVIPILVQGMFEQAQRLHTLGVRNFLFFELAPVDWTPFYQNEIPVRRNRLASYYLSTFNILLHDAVEEFQEWNRDSKVNLISTPDLFMTAILNPETRGSPNATCVDEVRGEACLWADRTHPGKSLHKSMAQRAAIAAWGWTPPK